VFERIHPSEPNYIWAEAGTNFGILNDNDPYRVPGGTNQNTTQHLSTLLTNAGRSWRSYQEDIDLVRDSGGQLTNTVQAENLWTVPLTSFSGVFSSGLNEYNFSNQYNYAAKHNPMVFFTDANGGNDATPSNPLSSHYAPLQQLLTDLANNTVAEYNWITPNQYNDMHTTLQGRTHERGRPAVRQPGEPLALVVPADDARDLRRGSAAGRRGECQRSVGPLQARPSARDARRQVTG